MAYSAACTFMGGLLARDALPEALVPDRAGTWHTVCFSHLTALIVPTLSVTCHVYSRSMNCWPRCYAWRVFIPCKLQLQLCLDCICCNSVCCCYASTVWSLGPHGSRKLIYSPGLMVGGDGYDEHMQKTLHCRFRPIPGSAMLVADYLYTLLGNQIR